MSRSKPQKDAPRASKTPVASGSILDQTRATMAKACVALDSCVDRSTAMLAAGDYDKGLASHLAWLTKQLAGVTSELRKLEAHDEKIVAKLSPEKRDTLVMAYLKGLPPSRQTSIAAELQAMADRGGLLA